MYFRAFFGVPDSMNAPDGTSVNAVRGFLDMIARLVTLQRPARLVACWDDDWRPAFRVALLPTYKTHRLEAGTNPAANVEETPDLLAPQVPIIADVLAALGIARVGAPDAEADDVIGTLAARDAGPVDVVSGDRDLIQVVDDARGVRVLYIGRGLAKMEVMDEAAVAGQVRHPRPRLRRLRRAPWRPLRRAAGRTRGRREDRGRPRPALGARWRRSSRPSTPATPRSRSGRSSRRLGPTWRSPRR